jgi:hypothetical protein
VSFSGSKEEENMGWGFFQCFEKGVKRLGGKHMDFVDYVDLEATAAGHILNVFAQLTNFIDSSVRGPIDFEDVKRGALGNLLTGLTNVAWRRCGAVFTIHGLGHNPSNRCLANSPGAGKKKSVSYSVRSDSVFQCS